MRKLLVILAPFALVVAVVAVAAQSGSSSPTRNGDGTDDAVLNTQPWDAPAATGAPGGDTAYSTDADRGGEAPAPAPEGWSTGGVASAGGGVGGGTNSLPPAQVLERKIIRDSMLDVTVEDVPGSVQAVETAALGAGGFVSSSNLTIETPPEPLAATPTPAPGEPVPTPQPERQRATVKVRVPAETYPGVLSEFRKLGKVMSEVTNSTEVTEEYTDLEARLRNLQATEQRYLDLMNKAEVIPDILTVQDRLNAVRLEIEQVQGRMKLLDDLTDLATITVNLSLPPIVIEQQPAPEAEPGWAEEAWENAWATSRDVLETLGAAAIVAGVILIWVLVPVVLLGVAWRLFSAIARRGTAS